MKKTFFSVITILCVLISTIVLPSYADGDGAATIPEGYATIDGVISEGEWDEAQSIAVNQACTADTKDSECTESESSLTFRAMWDADYLYLLIEIVDDQLVINENTGTSYRNDSIFVYIGEDFTSHTAYGNSTYMLCFFPYVDATDYDSFNENGKTGTFICRNGAHDVSGDKYVCVTEGDAENGYRVTMECAVMWDYILPAVGESIAFDIQYNDSNSDLYGSTSNNREAIWSWSAVGADAKGPVGHLDLMGELEMIAAQNPINRPESDGDGNEGENEGGTQDGEGETVTTTTTTTAPNGSDPDTDSGDGNEDGNDKDPIPLIPIVIGVTALFLVVAVIVIIVKRKKQ